MTHLTHSLATYQTIRERIIALETDIDEETLADTLEGLTDLHEVIAAVVRAALFDEALAAGLKGHIQVLQDRLRHLNERAITRRRIARDAMLEVDVRKIKAPDFTLSMRTGSPALAVTDEAAIPDIYWKPRAPVLDRAALLGDLKAGVPVSGSAMTNPEPILSVRVR